MSCLITFYNDAKYSGKLFGMIKEFSFEQGWPVHDIHISQPYTQNAILKMFYMHY